MSQRRRVGLLFLLFVIISSRSFAAPAISVAPTTLSFTGQQYSAVASQMLTVSNSGDADLNYTLSSDMFWLSAANPTGTLPAGAATSHVVTVSTRGLDALHSYTGHLTTSDPSATNNPQLITVTLTLSPAAPPSRVVAWGNNTYHQTNVPAALTNAIVIAGGGYHSLAIRRGGSVVAWGTNGYGQTNVPVTLTNAIAISCGWYHSLALKPDGTLAVWGRNIEGETNLPTSLTNVIAIAGGSYHSLAVLADGTVAAWGFNFYGQTNVPNGLTNVVAVAGGNYHSLALLGDGTVTAWGSDDYDQSTVPTGLATVVAIAAGGYHSLALLNNGTVTAWGRNVEGQLNIPTGLSNVVSISAGNYHSLALKSDGTVITWGRNVEGQTNVPASLIHATAASAGGYHSMALAPVRALSVSSSHGSPNPDVGMSWPIPDTLVACSVNSNVLSGGTQYVNTGWIGSGDIPPSGTSNSISYTVTNDSTLTWVWQTNYWLNVFASSGGMIVTPPSWQTKCATVIVHATNQAPQTLLGWLGDTNGCTFSGTDITIPITQARTIEARFSEPLIATPLATLSFTGQLYSAITDQTLMISNSGTGPLAFTLDSDSIWLSATPNSGLLPVGLSTTCVVHVSTRGLQAQAYQGRLIVRDPMATNSPVSTAVTLALESLPTASEIIGWGDNSGGQSSTPGTITNALAVAAGTLHSIALRADHTVYCWGDDTYGQLDSPGDLTDAIAVAAGTLHSLALHANGTVAAWGQNANGQTDVPVDLTNVVAIAGGGNHSLALDGNGLVTAWGDNSSGQTNVPPGLSNVLSIAGGWNHSLALLRNGSVVGWGDNSSGQTDVPLDLSNVVAIAAASNYSLALRLDGSIVGWGDNTAGQTTVPVGITNAMTIVAGAGGSHALALLPDGTVMAWGANSQGQTTVPASVLAIAVAGGTDHSIAVVPTLTLGISSSLGFPNPGGGLHRVIRGSLQTCSITPSITAGGTQYVNMGWAGMGSVPLSGTTNSVSFAVTNDSSIAWLWNTNYQLSLSAMPGGSVSSNSGWYAQSTNVTVTATGNAGYGFMSWLGDTNGCILNGSTITVAITQARNIQALFDTPLLSQTPSTLQISGRTYSTLTGQSLVVSNAGFGTMNYSLTSDVFWLNVSNSSGSVGSQQAATHTVNVSTRGLEARSYYGHITITSPDVTNGSQTVVVMLTLTNPIAPVVAWGDNTSSQTNVPASLTNAVAISAGDKHAVALRANGRIAVWGDNSSGQTNIPAAATNVILINSGWNHTLALLPNRTVVAWGNNASGQTNVPSGLTNILALAGGWKHSMALRSNGTVVAWGNNTSGQTNVPAGLTNVVQITAGKNHSMALRADGRIVAWGDNTYGQTNVPAGLTNVVAIKAGGNHSVALRADGRVVAWGNNASGQTNVPSSLTNVIAIDAGSDDTMALRNDGQIVAWGDNASGQTNVPKNLFLVAAISGGRAYSMALVPLSRSVVVTSTYGNPSPSVGTNWVALGTLQACSVTSAITVGSTQYECVGWTGTGSISSNGSSNAVSFTLTTNSTLIWQWRTNFWLQTATNGAGSVSPTSAWYRASSNAILTAIPDTYWHFVNWTGDVPVQAVASNPVTVVMSAPRYVQARFTNNVTTNGTPEVWLASHGWTTNFETAATNDWDGDGLLTWEEYVADLDPTNATSTFQMLTASNLSRTSSVTFLSSTGRVYSLYLSTSITTGLWQAISGQTNVPGNGGTLTLTNTNAPLVGHYYRVRVKLP